MQRPILTGRAAGLMCVLLGLLALPRLAPAQEAIQTDAATQPSPGLTLVRERFKLLRFGEDDDRLFNDVTEWQARTSISHGLTRDLAFTVTIPLIFRETDSDFGSVDGNFFGIDDVMIMGKYRLWQDDFGPINTQRISLLAGGSVPVGREPFTSDSFDPMVGGVYTLIYDRHGFNAAARYRFNSGDDETYVHAGAGDQDALFLDSAYLWRLAPEAYNANTAGSWYAVLEGNYVYETGGNNELSLAPGLMYEGQTWAFEASVQLPVWQDIDGRPEPEFGVTVGLRYFF